MKIKFYIVFLIVTFLFFNIIASANAITNKAEINTNNKNFNKEILLGAATITGNGTSSELNITLENNILIRLDSASEIVDFYIDYEMNCDGLTDEGIITLTIFLNDENISINLVQTPTSKNGKLLIENISVQRGDALTFRIDVVYGSVIPFYTNSTSATGIGVISKSKLISKPIFIFSSNMDLKNTNFEVVERVINIIENSLFGDLFKI